MKHDLDQLLTERLKHRLDAELGKARTRFEQVRLEQATRVASRRPRPMRIVAWTTGAALAAAACVAIAMLLAPDKKPTPTTAIHVTPPAPTTSIPDDVVHTRLVMNADIGPIMLAEDTPGRRVQQQQIDHYRWTDSSGAVFEYYVPQQQEILLRVHQQ